jgi:P27 family predicted phage terminase small subunit
VTARDPRSAAAPRHLTAATRRWHEAIAAEYQLEPQHLRLLVAAGEAWDEYQAARKIIATEGLVVRDRFGQAKPHPAVAIERDARTAFVRIIRELGLDDDPPPEPRPPRRGGGT